MIQMSKKFFAAAILAAFVLTGLNPAEAYDLPKVKIIKPSKKNPPKVEEKKESKPTLATNYAAKIKTLVESGKKIPYDSPERIYIDKNFVFICFYKNEAFFLDKFSLFQHKNSGKNFGWEQYVFPIGREISPKNAKAVKQNFYTDGKNIYNAKRAVGNIANVKDDEDRFFLEECFNVGYYYAFGKIFDGVKNSR